MRNLLILGAGRVGILTSCLLVKTGDYVVHLADRIIPENKPVLDRCVNNLKYIKMDAGNVKEMVEYIKKCNIDSVVSCLPFYCNLKIARMAKDLKINYFDLTEDVETTNQIKLLAEGAANFFAPQCGLAPGFISIVSNDLMKEFESVDTVRMRVGALPLNVSNALQYGLTWSTEGLVNEYARPCHGVVDGEERVLAPLADIEEIKVDGLTYEAFNTSGGIGSMIDTHKGKVRNINYKSIRYPGHCEKVKFLMDDMKLGRDLDKMVKIMDNALPRINQDMVLIYVSVNGVRKGIGAERHFAQKFPSKMMFERRFSAVQMTTASSLCVTIDLVLTRTDRFQPGFISQESINLTDFYENRFGGYYENEGLLIQAL